MTLTTLHTLELARAPGTAVIWLSRPDKGNALDALTIAELLHVFTELLDDPDARVIVLAGRGDAFCNGLDLDSLTTCPSAGLVLQDEVKRGSTHLEPKAPLTGGGEAPTVRSEFFTDALESELQQAAQLLATIRDANKPVIVRAHGNCAGIGMALAAAATLTVAARDARFAHTGTLLGVTPALSAPLIAAAIGPRAARRWLLTGETMDASEAWRLGLAHELCEADELDARINHILGHLINAAPAAASATLALLRATDIPDPATQARALATSLQSPDAHAGIAARRHEQAPPWVEQILRDMPEE